MKYLGVLFCAIALVAANMSSVFAAKKTEDVSALREEIARLNARIATLEEQLNDKMVDRVPTRSRRGVRSFSSPFDDLMAMESYFDRMMGGGPLFGVAPQAGAFRPDYDVKATDTAYLMTFDMPGMDKSRINVEVKEGMLLVSGERSSEDATQDQNGQFYRQTRNFGYFSRAIPLPEDALGEKIDAKYEQGVLTVTIGRKVPETAAPKAQKIEVK